MAYLTALDENSPILLPFQERSYIGMAGKSFSNIGRFQQTFWRDSFVGGIVTDRRFENNAGSGTTAGIDGRFRFLEKYAIEYQALASYTREPDDTTLTVGVNDMTFAGGKHTAAFDGEAFGGHAFYASFERDARTWFFDFDYVSSSPTFRADLGFENRNDFHRFRMLQGLIFYPDSRFVDQIIPVFLVQRIWNWDGQRKDDALVANLEVAWKGDTRTVIEYTRGFERFRGVDFRGQNNWFFYLNSGFSEFFRPGFWVQVGDRIARNFDTPLAGKGTDAEVWFDLKPLTQWILEPSLQFSKLDDAATGDELFSGFIVRMRTTFQFTREFSLRLVTQYDDFNRALSIEPLLTYQLNAFSKFFIGSTHAYQDPPDSDSGLTQSRRQFFAKFQYLFRN